MKVSAPALLLAAAAGVAAHPHGRDATHALLHRHLGEHKFLKAVHVKQVEGPYEVPYEAPASPSASSYDVPTTVNEPSQEPSVEPEPEPEPAPAPKPSSSAGSGPLDFSKFYCPYEPNSKQKRATAEQIAAPGNVGSNFGSGNKYGCNVRPVSPNFAGTVDSSILLTNPKDAQTVTCVAHLKAGPALKVNGSFMKPAVSDGTEMPWVVTLAGGQNQSVAVAEGSIGGISCFAGEKFAPEKMTDSNGQIAGSWLEYELISIREENKGWSGADISIITAGDASMFNIGMSVHREGHDNVKSSVCPGGKVNNAYDRTKKAADGIGLNFPRPGPKDKKIRLIVELNNKC